MVGWESQRNVQDSAGTNVVLTPAQRQGDFSAVSTRIIDPLNGLPFPGNIIPMDRLNPVSVNLTNTYMPLPNQPGAVNYAFLSQATTKWDQATERDWTTGSATKTRSPGITHPELQAPHGGSDSGLHF